MIPLQVEGIIMARPKFVFSEGLAERAKADLDTLDRNEVAMKLRAIISAAKMPIGQVAEVLGVAAETIWRWATAYSRSGLDGLRQKPKKPKPAKLDPERKAKVLSWVDAGKTPDGEDGHWTLEKLRQAILDEFGVTLSLNAIWVWLRKEGRKPKVPRPRHHQADAQAQEDFKKNSP
jgi:transposase